MTEGAGEPIRIVIVDDHTLFREGVRLILEPERDLAVVGEAATVGQALPLIHGTRPDLVLLDLRLAQERGIDLLSQLVASPGSPRVLIVTAFPEEGDIAEAVRLGAKGVVLKDATRDTLLAAIRGVAGGHLWLPAELTAKVIAALAHTAPSSLAERVALLTTREREIVSLVGQGLKNREIADRLGIAEKIARDLHDSFIQVLAALGLRLDVLCASAPTTPAAIERERRELAQIREIIGREQRRVRAYIAEMREPLRGPEGLREIVERAAEAFHARTQIPVDVSVRGNLADLPGEVVRELAPLLGEALTNVEKHARVQGDRRRAYGRPRATPRRERRWPGHEPDGRAGTAGYRAARPWTAFDARARPTAGRHSVDWPLCDDGDRPDRHHSAARLRLAATRPLERGSRKPISLNATCLSLLPVPCSPHFR